MQAHARDTPAIFPRARVPATYFGLRGAGDLSTTYIVAVLLLVLPLSRVPLVAHIQGCGSRLVPEIHLDRLMVGSRADYTPRPGALRHPALTCSCRSIGCDLYVVTHDWPREGFGFSTT
jgi:hypothetical protein